MSSKYVTFPSDRVDKQRPGVLFSCDVHKRGRNKMGAWIINCDGQSNLIGIPGTNTQLIHAIFAGKIAQDVLS